jgi:hypothetical protein
LPIGIILRIGTRGDQRNRLQLPTRIRTRAARQRSRRHCDQRKKKERKTKSLHDAFLDTLNPAATSKLRNRKNFPELRTPPISAENAINDPTANNQRLTTNDQRRR